MSKVWNCCLNLLSADVVARRCDACQASELCQSCPEQIVIVDDDHDFLEEISDFLDFSGFVIHAHSVRYEAMSLIKEHDFEVLLSDIEMAGMRGTQLAAWLTDRRPEIKAILISGLDIAPTDIRDGWLFFRKPFDLSRLLLAIESH